MPFFRRIHKIIFGLNASELTVISFVLMSVLGGILLYFSEKNRLVTNYHPELRNVLIEVQENDTNEIVEPQEQVHTVLVKNNYKSEKFIDTLFTSISALCVTGLTSTDFSEFTLTGQVIVLVLIQMGGLGIIVFTSFFAMSLFKGISEASSFKKMLSSLMDTKHHDVIDMIKVVIITTILFEGAGFLIMGAYLQFFVDPVVINGINPWWWALFHSVSAFNNAGFSLLNNNLVNFVADPVINLVIATLIILGGLGYPVILALYYLARKVLHKRDLLQKELQSDLSGVASQAQMKVAIKGTIILLVIGTVLPLVLEWDNLKQSGLSNLGVILASFFQSVSTRTAGFNTVDIGLLHIASLFLYMGLMFVGANPAGTAGGIKIPTIAVLYAYVKDWFDKPGQALRLSGHVISKFALSHAIRLFFFSFLFIGAVTFGISVIEKSYLITPDPIFNYLKILFEVFSAFGTVGLSMGFSGSVTSFSAVLQTGSKFLIILTMLFGRLGPLTILASLPWKRRYADALPSLDYENAQKVQIG